MLADVLIIHGSYGSPDENWFPWLKKELERLDCRVFVPKFPTPKNQNLESWLKVFNEYKKYLDKNSILIGHSLGCAFILSLLERLNIRIKAAFLVAGFIDFIGNDYFDTINRTFIKKKFDWEKIRKNCKYFFAYSSDNDHYMPLSMGEELAKKLNAKLKIIKNAGHFNEKSGYLKFEILLEDVKNHCL